MSDAAAVTTGLSGTQFVIRAGEHEATIVEVGAGLNGYRHAGVDVTCSYGDDDLPPKCCGATLVPWPNRIRDGAYTFDGTAQQLALTEPDKGNAIHGLGRWERWTVVEQAADTVTLGLDVVPQKGYPFQIHVEVRYTVDAHRGLTVHLSARNDGATRAPFGIGSHPYLSTRGQALDDVRLSIPVMTAFDVDDQQIPVRRRPIRSDEDFGSSDLLGTRRFDQGFTDVVVEEDVSDDHYSMVQLSGDGFGACLWFEPAFRYLQVFTVDDLTPGRSGIAIEPMTCAADAFNSGDGLIVLEPADVWSGSWGIVPA